LWVAKVILPGVEDPRWNQRAALSHTTRNSLETVHHRTIEPITGRGQGEDGEDQVEFEEITFVPLCTSSAEDGL